MRLKSACHLYYTWEDLVYYREFRFFAITSKNSISRRKKKEDDLMKYGYVQVSTREQNEQRQMLALKEYRIEKTRIFMDTKQNRDPTGTLIADIVL